MPKHSGSGGTRACEGEEDQKVLSVPLGPREAGWQAPHADLRSGPECVSLIGVHWTTVIWLWVYVFCYICFEVYCLLGLKVCLVSIPPMCCKIFRCNSTPDHNLISTLHHLPIFIVNFSIFFSFILLPLPLPHYHLVVSFSWCRQVWSHGARCLAEDQEWDWPLLDLPSVLQGGHLWLLQHEHRWREHSCLHQVIIGHVCGSSVNAVFAVCRRDLEL